MFAALEKIWGGVRPIVVGCTMCHLVAKVAGNLVYPDMTSLLAPWQLGFGIRGGANSAVHAARQYLDNLQINHALLKLDFSNALNFVYRDRCLMQF